MTGETGDDEHDDASGDSAPSEDAEHDDPTDENGDGDEREPGDGSGVDAADLAEDIAAVRAQLEALEERIDERTVHRDEIRAELERYVRRRQRRGHATGWGPYLVLLYGVAMTVGAFYYLAGWVAVVAMVVVWLSTLGLYVFMVVVGAALGVGRRVVSLRDLLGRLRR